MSNFTHFHYEGRFRNAFLESKGNAFQSLFDLIMGKAYPGQFMPGKPYGNIGDQKNDGYLSSERTLFQVYAPDEMKAKKAAEKMEEDLIGALTHWEGHFDKWVFVYNSNGLTPDVQRKVMELREAHPEIAIETWGWEELRLRFNSLSLDAKQSMYGPALTNEAKQNLNAEEIQHVLDHIIASEVGVEPVDFVLPPGKIEHNRLTKSTAGLLMMGFEKAYEVAKYFDQIGDPTYADRIANSFKEKYADLRDADPPKHPDDIFHGLAVWAGIGNTHTSGQLVAIYTILAYFFEQCEIFDPPPHLP
jgi:hypothetical protein